MTEQQQHLTLGRMPLHATPKTHLAAGPWCFAGQEERFPHWESHYTFAPEPLADLNNLDKAARESMGLTAQYIPLLARHLRDANLPPLPETYWDMALAPWLIFVSQKVVDTLWRVRSMVEAWGDLPLRVELLPRDCPFSFETELNYMWGGGLGHAYTHWVFSRVLETCWPEKWEKIYVSLPPEAERFFAPKPLHGLGHRFRHWLRQKALWAMHCLPFPRVRSFTPGQCWQFSRALRQNRQGQDQSRSVNIWLNHSPLLPSGLDFMAICLNSLPTALRRAKHPASLSPARRARLRVGTIHVFEDTDYRLRLARWRAQGHKLAFVQHGGNYGNVRVTSMDPIMEYLQHAFITWGWDRQTPWQGNFVPLPPALLAEVRNRHEEKNGQLIYVGTEIPVFAYRMDSRLTPLQYVQYREDKLWFLEALPAEVQDATLYRPYFDVPGTLEDAPWLLPQFPRVHLCTGPLLPQLLQCRLLVLDHHGTTLLQALAANIPSVLFWDKEQWSLCPEAEALLDKLAEARIWHPTAESAAMHIRSIWSDVGGWWRSETVQKARQAWADHYALTVAPEKFDEMWVKALKHM